MQEKIKKSNQIKNRELILISSFLILIGTGIIISKYIYNYSQYKKEETLINSFYEEQKDIVKESEINIEETSITNPTISTNTDYIAVIKIPKIKLEKGICRKDSSCNNVNKNIQILKEADYPDIEKGNFILASHSGSGRVAYFKNLYKLSINDDISIFYGGNEYKYKVKNIYDIDKTGTANIVRNMEKTTLTLITCRQGTKKQIIIICELLEN